MTTQLPKERLAAYEQEPEQYQYRFWCGDYSEWVVCDKDDFELYAGMSKTDSSVQVRKLYTHPATSIPAAVPEEITDMKLKKAFLWIDDVIRHNPGMKEAVTCRAAMLQAEPVKPAVPDGYLLVPIEPTEDMVVNGFESEPFEGFSEADVWEAYQAMSGCQQAAHRAKLCWAAMIAAAPKEV